MANKGRPRDLKAKRYPSGGVYHKKDDPRLTALTANPRLDELNALVHDRGKVLKFLGSTDFGSQLGRLHLKGRITEHQRDAGDKYIQLCEKHRRIVLDGQTGRPKAGSYERRSPGAQKPEYDDDMIKEVQDDYDAVFVGVMDSGRRGMARLKALNKLCIEDQLLDYNEEQLVKEALDLVYNLLLTGGTKREKAQ